MSFFSNRCLTFEGGDSCAEALEDASWVLEEGVYEGCPAGAWKERVGSLRIRLLDAWRYSALVVACHHPLKAWRLPERGSSGRRLVSFSTPSDERLELPCGQCIGCRLEYSRQWAVRCMHEASLYDENCLISLTYDDEHLPRGSSLDRDAFPLFMKRLRKEVSRGGRRVRYFYCGEYGGRNGRPHYHALLFNYGFPDRRQWTVRNGYPVWRSAQLEKLWPDGQSEIGSVTFESAAYVARYVAKKLGCKRKSGKYAFVDRNGQWVHLEEEFAEMSRCPGIGKEYVLRFKDEILRDDAVVSRGRLTSVPRYYDGILAELEPERHASVCRARRRAARLMVEAVEASGERIEDRRGKEEVCAQARVDQQTRRL